MHMKKFSCEKKYGQTSFLSLIELFNKCPKLFIDKLSLEKLEHHRDVHQHNFKQETTKTDQYPGIFSPLRIHPVTCEPILFWPSFSNVKLHGEETQWFIDFKNWVNDYLSQEDNWYNWEYDQNDLLIWDNRCLLHSFSPGWKQSDRIFDQLVIGFQLPKIYNLGA